MNLIVISLSCASMSSLEGNVLTGDSAKTWTLTSDPYLSNMAASMGGPSWQAPDDGATLKLVRNLDFCIFHYNYLYNL